MAVLRLLVILNHVDSTVNNAIITEKATDMGKQTTHKLPSKGVQLCSLAPAASTFEAQ